MLNQDNLRSLFSELLQRVGLNLQPDSILYNLLALLVILCISWLAYRIARFVFHGKVGNLVLSTKNQWDDELHKHGFFQRGGHIIPALLIYLLSPLLITSTGLLLTFLHKSAIIYLIIAAVSAGSAFLHTVEAIYQKSHLASRVPITGFVQVTKLLLIVSATLIIVASILDKSPLLLLSGLGAVTAILLLLFKDTILGFVAGIQIAANRMVNTGDWIEMPEFGADGDVLEVGLTTVKVQNWDKTISTIPTYALVTNSMKNWRGMTESAGRRIKRAIYIDIHSVKFCDQNMLEEFQKIRYISKYIEGKKQELADFHNLQKIDNQDLLNSRRLTNIGTLRAYMLEYLRHNPKINQDMTLMVRQLPPNELGLPLEVYCFSADKNWVAFEAIQADLFDHFLAILPIFKLRAYQRVSNNN